MSLLLCPRAPQLSRDVPLDAGSPCDKAVVLRDAMVDTLCNTGENWAGHVKIIGERREILKIYLKFIKRHDHFGSLRHKWEVVSMYLVINGIGYVSLKWILVIYDRYFGLTVVSKVMDFRVAKNSGTSITF